MTRRDHPLAEGLSDHAPGQGDDLGIDLNLGGSAGLQPTDHQGLGRGETLRIAGGQDLHQPVPKGGRQAIRHGPVPRHIDPDALGIPAHDHIRQGLPLGVQVASGPGRRVGPPQGVTVDGKALHRPVGLAEEDQHGRPAGGEGRLRDECEIDGVLSVLAVDDDPHVEAGLGHQARQKRIEPVRQDPVLHLDPRRTRQDIKMVSRGEVPALVRAVGRRSGGPGQGHPGRKDEARQEGFALHVSPPRIRPTRGRSVLDPP